MVYTSSSICVVVTMLAKVLDNEQDWTPVIVLVGMHVVLYTIYYGRYVRGSKVGVCWGPKPDGEYRGKVQVRACKKDSEQQMYVGRIGEVVSGTSSSGLVVKFDQGEPVEFECDQLKKVDEPEDGPKSAAPVVPAQFKAQVRKGRAAASEILFYTVFMAIAFTLALHSRSLSGHTTQQLARVSKALMLDADGRKAEVGSPPPIYMQACSAPAVDAFADITDTDGLMQWMKGPMADGLFSVTHPHSAFAHLMPVLCVPRS